MGKIALRQEGEKEVASRTCDGVTAWFTAFDKPASARLSNETRNSEERAGKQARAMAGIPKARNRRERTEQRQIRVSGVFREAEETCVNFCPISRGHINLLQSHYLEYN